MTTTYQNEICPKCGEINGHSLGCDYDEREYIKELEAEIQRLGENN